MELSKDGCARLLLLCGLVLCFFAPQGECIKCYECNSEYDPRCADPFDSYTIGEVDCDLKPKPDHLANYSAILCRKIAQKVNGLPRVVRSCGYLPPEDDSKACFFRSGTYEVHMQYCSCKNDLCNGAPGALAASPAAVTVAAVASLALAARLSLQRLL